jgi:hypothetical protein
MTLIGSLMLIILPLFMFRQYLGSLLTALTNMIMLQILIMLPQLINKANGINLTAPSERFSLRLAELPSNKR